jgi:hypothetical protein
MTDTQPFPPGANNRPHQDKVNLLVQTDTLDAAAVQEDHFNDLGALEDDSSIPTVQTKTKIAVQQAGGMMFWNLFDDSWGRFLAWYFITDNVLAISSIKEIIL